MALSYFPSINQEESEIREKAQNLSKKLIAPTIQQDDENQRYPKEIFQAFGKEGLIGSLIAKEFGGGNKSSKSYYASIDEIAQFSVSFAIVIGVSNLTMGGIVKFGTEKQKQNYLPKLAKGEWLGAFSLSEPGSGSDAASLQLQAKKMEGGYLLNGNKVWCSNAGHADLYLLMARTGPEKSKGITSFLVEKNTKGFRIGKQEKKMGLKSSSLAELVFEDCFLPTDTLLGQEGQGFQVALSQLEAGRIGIASCGIGAATRVLELLTECKATQTDKTADYYARLLSLKALLSLSTQLKDQGTSKTVHASALKLLATDLAMEVSTYALDFVPLEQTKLRIEFERIFRDSKALQIVEGTNQIQKVILSREMGIQL